MKKILLLVFIWAISGCSLSFVATDLKPVKANLEYWMKPGMTGESRIRDAGDCGGGYTNYTGFSESAIATKKMTVKQIVKQEFVYFMSGSGVF